MEHILATAEYSAPNAKTQHQHSKNLGGNLKMKKRIDTAELATRIVAGIGCILLIWIIASFCEINAKNKIPDAHPEYSKYNAFEVLLPEQEHN